MTYRIKTVAAMTGIQRGTLLAWERRYDLLDPQRTKSGYRMYSDADVAKLKRIKLLVDAGHPISEAVGMVRVTDAGRGDPLPAVVDALMRFDRTTADRVLPEIQQMTFDRALDEVYLPALRWVGDAWASGDASVAQEHYASGWCREQMLGMFHALGGGPDNGPTVTCALPSDELHELGVLAVAVKLALRGWRVTWLGALLPLDELGAYLTRERPQLVCLSLVRERPEADVLDYALDVRRRAPITTRVAVGGPAVAGLEQRSTKDLVFASTWDSLWAQIGSGT